MTSSFLPHKDRARHPEAKDRALHLQRIVDGGAQSQFDQLRATGGALARSCAALLDAQCDERLSLAPLAQSEWRGRARDEFDRRLDRMVREAAGLVDALRAAANRSTLRRRTRSPSNDASVQHAPPSGGRTRRIDALTH